MGDSVDTADDGPPALEALDLPALADLLALCEWDRPGTSELVQLFLTDSREQIDALRQVTEDRDLGSIARLAHSLRGSSAMFAASGMATLCAALESGATNAEPGTSAIARLEVEFARVSAALRAAFHLPA